MFTLIWSSLSSVRSTSLIKVYDFWLDSSMTTINSVNRLRRSAELARCAESAEHLTLLTEFIVVIDELRLYPIACFSRTIDDR